MTELCSHVTFSCRNRGAFDPGRRLSAVWLNQNLQCSAGGSRGTARVLGCTDSWGHRVGLHVTGYGIWGLAHLVKNGESVGVVTLGNVRR